MLVKYSYKISGARGDYLQTTTVEKEPNIYILSMLHVCMNFLGGKVNSVGGINFRVEIIY